MTAEPPVSPATAGEPARPRRRDATETRQLLLDAARQRFARDGYAATTVRDIADDAGVNVALINRYFSSKEGLFEACLRAAGDELRRTTGQTPADRVPEAIARHIADLGTAGLSSQLTLLLRSSGDAGADEIRRGVLSRASEQLAAARGWRPGEPGGEQILLRAQMALAAGIGVAVLRSSSIQLEPLSSATEEDLVGPLRDLVDALLPPR
ncbi:TetR family transcriptional regulator [Micromonospora sp. LAH09]|uniref:TetR/AcrR family transcriptional regulator n=1 Tax=Micromonospora cabrerizensis TaxID=2911213 RepID=UPI001EE88316|nr:TetR/AcrR family transcriptional regulator [Micromonospora cabrerizensis]MCG5468553.1 TetR family transcriptional regulator [Micromonospora cabrerizensis]